MGMSKQLPFNSITAAWCEDGALEPHTLRVAVGSPAWQASTDVLADIPALLDQAHQQAQAGFTVLACVPYEAAPAFDSSLKVRSGSCCTQAVAYRSDQLKSLNVAELLHTAGAGFGQAHGLSPWLDECEADWFDSAYAQVRRWIEAGDFYQINLTTRLRARMQALGPQALFALFLKLFEQQPAAYSVFLNLPQFTVLSLSPELFFSWDATGKLQTRPMKGTRKPVSGSASSLADSGKDRAENLMIVDLLRNDLARVCKPRSVQVDSLFDVMKLPSVEQMTSTISGVTHEQLSLSQVFRALFPCGSVTGAPKAQAMRRITELECSPRGVYCGAIGLLKPDGQLRFSVPIRTVLARPAGGGLALEYGVGSGVTWYSEPRDEKREWWQKTVFLRRATVDFEILETLRLDDSGFGNLEQHLARMEASAQRFSFVWNEAAMRKRLNEVLDAYRKGGGGVLPRRVRCLLGPAGDVRVECFDLEPTPTWPVRLLLADRSIEQALQGSGINLPFEALKPFIANKTTFRPHYDVFALRTQSGEPCFDTLLYDNSGVLTETCRFNLVVDVGGKRLTPAISPAGGGNLLPGVFRQRLLGENKIEEENLTLNDLNGAQGLWLINSLRGWIEVGEVLSSSGELLYARTDFKR